jgi:cyclomaltodextrinase
MTPIYNIVKPINYLIIKPFVLLSIFFSLILTKNNYPQPIASEVVHPAWSYNKTIYEVNIRQYTKSGTFKAFEKRLPELKKMGVGILWIMPINPIGIKNRKGELGSYYSVKDYFTVNPEFGSADDFKELVKKIHSAGMYVILDWVADHTSWDNNLTKEHPDFYKKDSAGNFIAPVKDWTDVIALDYDNKNLWAYMIKALKFWVEKYDVDGFRCDVADMVPTPFWVEARKQLNKIKPVFMLAESEKPELQVKAFDMTYSWDFYKLMNNIAKGKDSATGLISYFKRESDIFPVNDYRMRFTSNHDENSWNGTEFERLGAAAPTFAALTFVIPGMPLIYSGQEAGQKKRLDFFARDPIEWKESPFRSLYTKLVHLKTENEALWNGTKGGKMILVSANNDKSIFSFIREKGTDKIFTVFNLTDKQVNANLSSDILKGNYTNYFIGKNIVLTNKATFKLKPWEYLIFVLK